MRHSSVGSQWMGWPSGCKHINMKWAWVQDLKNQDTVKLQKIDGEINLADAMTKVQNTVRFKTLNEMIKAVRT